MEIDDDILIIHDINRPKQPAEDPLEVSSYKQKEIKNLDNNKVDSKTETENIINLDSSDDETPTVNHNNENHGSSLYKNIQTAIRNTTKGMTKKSEICSGNKKNKIIDESLHSDMYNQLPTAEGLLEPSHNRSRADVPRKQNLTYLGKIIRIPGQPSLIENSSGLIFRADAVPSFTNTEKANNVENEMDLYRNFFNRAHQGHNRQSPNQNLLTEDLFIESAFPTLATKIPVSSAGNKRSAFQQSLSSKNMNPSETQLRSQQSVDNISGKKCQPIQSKGQSVRKQISKRHAPLVIPFQPNSTLLDLNLNINNTESVTNPINTISPSQSTMMSPNDSRGRYNLALDLVLNVNDRNQANSLSQMSPQNHTNLNNVALDVSLNVNNKGKPATMTSTQIGHSPPPQYIKKPLLNNRDEQMEVASTKAGNSYCCGLCLFKTTDLKLLKTHVCPAISTTCLKKSLRGIYKKIGNSYHCNLCLFKTVDFPVMKAHEPLHYTDRDQCLRSNSIEKIYCCVACTFQTFDLKVMELHVCALPNRVLINKIEDNTPLRNKDSEFLETPAQKLGIEIHQNRTVQKNIINDSLEASIEKIYGCVACTFQTSDFEFIKCHVCPSDNTMSPKIVNMEHVETTGQNSLDEPNNYQNKGIQTVYNCASCTLQTTDLKFIKAHKCPLVSSKNKDSVPKQVTCKRKVATGKQVSQSQQAEFYCCMSCSFKTKNVSLVQSHRCRGSKAKTDKTPSKVSPIVIPYKQKVTVPGLEKTPNLQPTLNNLNEVVESSVKRKKVISGSVFICKICRQSFSREYLLFHHLRHTHFGVRTTTIFGCYLCTYYVENIDAVIHHLQETHRTLSGENEKIICKELYMCTACNIQTDTFQNITMHFDAHIESYRSILKISYQQDPSKIRLHKSSSTTDDDHTYKCILCGEVSDRITSWLTHVCKDDEESSEVSQNCKRKGQETIRPFHSVAGKRTHPRRSAPKEDVCYHCITPVIGDVLKCDNSECDALYHLKCVEVYGRFMHPRAINRRYNWFCMECTDNIVPFQDDVENISLCMELADKEYLLEVEKQKLMVNEMKKIKSEKVKMKEDFERIKKFICECRSERINNVTVKSVCTIVESFINAGIENSTDYNT